MNIDIKTIKDRGNADKERLVLQVHQDDDVGRYIVFATSSAEDGGVSNKVKSTYWFPDRTVAEGDLVVLYTKGGLAKVQENVDGSKSHLFYWGLEKPLWEDTEDYAVVLEAHKWHAQEVAAL